jgi:AraC-like DNA-binding protein
MHRLDTHDRPDFLGDVLGAVRFRSTIFCRSELAAPWGFSVSGREIATFHFVEGGAGWLEVSDSAAPVRVEAGDLVVLPHGHAHVMRDAPGSTVTRLDDLLSARSKNAGATLRFGGEGPETTLICGGFAFDNREALPFLPALPPVLHVRDRGARVGNWLRLAQELITDALASDRMGENVMLSRVSDLIFIEAVRSYFSDVAGSARGWFAALEDRHIGKAVSIIHRGPHLPWTVASLAREVGLSRTAFAIRFSLLLGESPMRYVVGRRIARAESLLEGGDLALPKIAEMVGYESEAALSRAFKRLVGISPVAYRRAKSRRRGFDGGYRGLQGAKPARIDEDGEVGPGNPNGVQDPDVRESALAAQAIDSRRAEAELRRGLAHRQKPVLPAPQDLQPRRGRRRTG